MLKIILLVLGGGLLLFQQNIFPFSNNTQFIIFLSGVLLLGVPHGAADLLVATQNANGRKKAFSKLKFLSIYISRLLLFGLLIWLFPIAGILLFIFFAAYHFGETDLHQFKTNTVAGKAFVIFYGLMILAVILLPHFEEVKPLLLQFTFMNENSFILNWIDINRYHIISASGLLFFSTAFIYFIQNRHTAANDKGNFLVRLAIILFILFNLPLLLGFTFYFVIWHSVLSLTNITAYLKKNNANSNNSIQKQIIFYSILAIGGIALFGLTGFMFTGKIAIAGYMFFGLAVLTAPHMQIMHDMYNSIRQLKPAEN